MENRYDYIPQKQLPRALVIFIFSAYPIMGVGALGLDFYLLYDSLLISKDFSFITVYAFILGLSIALFLLACGWATISGGLTKYRFETEGLIAKFPLRSEELFAWSDFQQICICYAAYTSSRPRKANTVICCVKKGESVNSIGRWKTENIFRYKTIIIMDYEESVCEALSKKCPMEVVDLRNSPWYRL